MFEDRSKNYDFKKLDSNARTQLLIEKNEKTQNMTEAQKKLFAVQNKKKKQEPILPRHENINVSNLPSSKYLQSFSNTMTVGEAETNYQQEVINNEEKIEQIIQEQPPKVEVNFDNLIEEANEIKVDDKQIKKELKNATPSPKKNYSFRIKLVAGVYCILVALFGGWVIGNSIDIAQTNSNIYQATTTNNELNVNIAKIILEIKKYDNVTENPNDDSLLVEMTTEILPVIPEETTEPNEYQQESNW